MNFELESWEVPPGVDMSRASVPIEFGPVEWNGELTLVSARTVPNASRQSLVFFHPHAGGVNFAVLINDNFGVFKAQTHDKKLDRIVRETLRTKKFYYQTERFYFGRVFYLEGQLGLIREGESFWAYTNSDWIERTPTRITLRCNERTFRARFRVARTAMARCRFRRALCLGMEPQRFWRAQSMAQ